MGKDVKLLVVIISKVFFLALQKREYESCYVMGILKINHVHHTGWISLGGGTFGIPGYWQGKFWIIVWNPSVINPKN